MDKPPVAPTINSIVVGLVLANLVSDLGSWRQRAEASEPYMVLHKIDPVLLRFFNAAKRPELDRTGTSTATFLMWRAEFIRTHGVAELAMQASRGTLPGLDTLPAEKRRDITDLLRRALTA